jgi:DNA-binding Lrp family transcriptional regulator
MQSNIEERIVEILKKNPEGLTIVDIAKKLNMHRHTTSKYVYGLARAGVIRQRKIGVASLCYLNHEKRLLE